MRLPNVTDEIPTLREWVDEQLADHRWSRLALFTRLACRVGIYQARDRVDQDFWPEDGSKISRTVWLCRCGDPAQVSARERTSWPTRPEVA